MAIPSVSMVWRGRLAEQLDRLTERGLFLAVAVPLFGIYLLTATWSFVLVNDGVTNSLTAWNIAEHGSVYLEEHEVLEDYRGTLAWVVPAGGSVVSQYPPGAALMAVPLYAVWPGELTSVTPRPGDIPEGFQEDDLEGVTFLHPPVAPGAITAALTTAAAMGLLAVAFLRISGAPAMALGAAYVAGLGTSAWPVASAELWQHGPAMAWIALALVMEERHMLGSGLAFGAAILTRPPLAVIAATTGLFRSVRERSLRPAMLIGAGALVGLLAYVAYTWWVFGDPSISGGYGSGFQDRVVSGFGYRYFRTLFDAAFSQEVGIFVWSPFLLVLVPGIRMGWRASPSWARGSLLGGLLYLLVQYKANRATGGTFLGYRYPLEALVAAAPVLFLSYREWVAHRPLMKRLFAVSVAISCLTNGLASIGVGIL